MPSVASSRQYLCVLLTAGSERVDALNDSTEAFLWQWELRDAKVLRKADRCVATAHKKLMHKVEASLLLLISRRSAASQTPALLLLQARRICMHS